MRFTLKQLIYVIILFVVMALCVMTCTRQIIMPVVSQQEISEKEILVRTNYEDTIQENVSTLLNKLVGKKTFFVSVMVSLSEENLEESSLEKHPTIITKNMSNSYSYSENEFKHKVLSRRPTAAEIQSNVYANGGVLPGLVSQVSDEFEQDGLPGFPEVPTFANQEKRVENERDEFHFPKDRELQVKYDAHNMQNDVFFNEKTYKKLTPSNAVEKVFVSVVIDEERFELVNIGKETLENLVLGVAGLNLERGDQLSISFMPFVEKRYTFQQFYLKNKSTIDKVIRFFGSIKWYAFSLVLALLVGYISWKLYLYYLRRREEQRKIDQAEKAKRQEEEAEIQKVVDDELEEKRNDIISLASSKPGDFAMLIMNWVEAGQNGDEGDAHGK